MAKNKFVVYKIQGIRVQTMQPEPEVDNPIPPPELINIDVSVFQGAFDQKNAAETAVADLTDADPDPNARYYYIEEKRKD